jgi:hypothetical protein
MRLLHDRFGAGPLVELLTALYEIDNEFCLGDEFDSSQRADAIRRAFVEYLRVRRVNASGLEEAEL